MLYSEAFDFVNIDNPRSFTTETTFSSVRPRPRFQVVVCTVAGSLAKMSSMFTEASVATTSSRMMEKVLLPF